LIDVVRPTRAAYAAADPAESRFVVIKPFLGLKKREATHGRSSGLTGFGFRHILRCAPNGGGIGKGGPERLDHPVIALSSRDKGAGRDIR
jgi:hypothetical protein